MGKPTHQSGGFDGGVVSIDGRTIDAQFGFNNGTATREVIPWELGLLKNGSNLTVRINGELLLHFRSTDQLRRSSRFKNTTKETIRPPKLDLPQLRRNRAPRILIVM